MKQFKNDKEMQNVFDEGKESILEYADMDSLTVTRLETSMRRININMPVWLIDAIDNEASRVGANRQSYINMHMADELTRVIQEKSA